MRGLFIAFMVRSKGVVHVSTRQALDAAIYEKYIRPIQRPRKLYAGTEFELPIVNLAHTAVDFNVVYALTDAFIGNFDFDVVHYDDDGHIYFAEKNSNGDSLSYDCSFNTLEFSFGIEKDLNVIYRRFTDYYTFIQDFLNARNHTLTGMGVNPYHALNKNVPVANGRYRMLLHHLQSYPKYGDAILFHHQPNFGLFCAASQVQLDAQEDTVIDTLNVFARLEPLKALLFANSPFGDLLCSRDYFWKHSLHGLNPHNVDTYETTLHSVGELIAYIRSMSIYCLERDGKYINFAPTPLERYFSNDSVTGEYYDGLEYQNITFAPALEDLAYLRSFKFEDLTYRGTIEFRSTCEQPVSEIMGPAAFHAGLMEKVPELAALLDADASVYRQGYSPTELRELFVRRELPEFLDREAVSDLLIQVLDLAKEGLRKRGMHEERFLEPLYYRAGRLLSPARQMVDGLETGVPLEYYIKEYAKL